MMTHGLANFKLVEVFILYPVGLKSKTFDIQVDVAYASCQITVFL